MRIRRGPENFLRGPTTAQRPYPGMGDRVNGLSLVGLESEGVEGYNAWLYGSHGLAAIPTLPLYTLEGWS